MSSKIFISYRREDSSWSTGRIYDRLVKHFPESQIFIDIDSIGLGDDFVTYIEKSVKNCNVLLAIIGSKWLEIIKQKSEEVDFVRLEISAAIKNNIKVIPVLLENTKMPTQNELPEDIRPLARRNAFFINPISFNSEIEKLILNLKRLLSMGELSENAATTNELPIQMETGKLKDESIEHTFNITVKDAKLNQTPSLNNREEDLTKSFGPLNNLKDKIRIDDNITPKQTKLTSTFIITSDQKFNPVDFPSLQTELETVKRKLQNYPKQNSTDIIISFAKDHSFKSEWLSSNRQLANKIANQEIRLIEIERLFHLSKANITFQNQLQEYLRIQLQ